MSGNAEEQQNEATRKERFIEPTQNAVNSNRAQKGRALSGTTLHVYRLLYKEGRSLGVNEVKKKAGLSSASLAYYHLNKLVEEGLAKQQQGGYLVDKLVFESMIRIRRSLIPFQAAFAAFFATMIVGLLILLRPHFSSSYVIFIFALVTNCVALGIFSYQTIATLREYRG